LRELLHQFQLRAHDADGQGHGYERKQKALSAGRSGKMEQKK